MDAIPPSGIVPLPLTSFVGRTDELDLAQSLLGEPNTRILTLTGPGGIGKTRLAIELAHRLGPDYADGVTFVPLAAVPHHALVLSAIGSALGLRELDADRAPAAVATALGLSRRLLIVDNVEHLLDAALGLARLLAQCPNVKIVATSRSLLRVEGEHAIPVPPLSLPNPAIARTNDEWLQVPALRLFVDRARAVDPAYSWNEGDIAQLIEICSRLDGLPLALELAATRMRHLTLTELRDRLDERLPLLVDGSRDHPSRLQTMRNAIAWSHDLLSPGSQRLFRRLSVFRDGFALDTVVDVFAQLDGSMGGEAAMLDRLIPLIDASLLIRGLEPATGTARFRMLETIREYAWEQLGQSGERDAVRQAHAVACMHLAERYALADLMPSSSNAIERLIVERANLSAALTWLDGSPDTDHLLRLIAALGNFWTATTAYREATFWHERALARTDEGPSLAHAKIQVQLGMTRLLQGDLVGAEPALSAGLAACRTVDEPYHAALALIGLATAAILQGSTDLATRHLLACRELADSIPDRRLAEIVHGMVSLNLGVVSRATGQLDLAAEQISDMLDRARAAGYLQGTLIALGDLGDLARDRAEWERALAYYREGLTLNGNQPIKRTAIEIIESIAIVACRTGQVEQSAMLTGAAEALRARTGLRYIQPESRSSLATTMQENRAALGEAAFTTAWDTGSAWSAAVAIDAALAVQTHTLPSPPSGLTPRETEIARLLVLGLTDPEIADALFISVRTVENHVAHILAKLGVHTRTAAASTLTAL